MKIIDTTSLPGYSPHGIHYRFSPTDSGHTNCELTTEQLLAIEEGSTVKINGNTYVAIEIGIGERCLCGHTSVEMCVRVF